MYVNENTAVLLENNLEPVNLDFDPSMWDENENDHVYYDIETKVRNVPIICTRVLTHTSMTNMSEQNLLQGQYLLQLN